MRKSELRVIPSTLIVSTLSAPWMTIGIDYPLKPLFDKIISRVLYGFNFKLLVFAQDDSTPSRLGYYSEVLDRDPSTARKDSFEVRIERILVWTWGTSEATRVTRSRVRDQRLKGRGSVNVG